jgi:hypothetical protein
MAFILEGENQGVSEDENAREFESFENISDPEDGGDGQHHPERVPQLVIYYKSGTTAVKKQIGTDHTMRVYPNPVDNGILNFESADFQYKAFSLHDITGKTVKSGTIVSGDRQINVSDLGKGMFLIRFTTEKESVTRKIIIK